MLSGCGCPAGTHITDLPNKNCKQSLGQIQKIIFQRVYASAGVKNAIASNADKLATWTALFSASNSSKMTISPFVNNPTSEPGAARTFGGGNQTVNGIELIIGSEPSTFEGAFYQEEQDVIAAMKDYQCEPNMGVYLIDEAGNIGALAEPTAKTTYMPIPIEKLFIGDKKLGGLEEPDSNAISWSFMPNWSDNLVIINRSTLEFDPLTALVNVASS